jgi:hypothetical protein
MFTDVSEALATSVIRVMIEAVQTSETSVNITRPHGAATQNTAVFILAAVRNLNHHNHHALFIVTTITFSSAVCFAT